MPNKIQMENLYHAENRQTPEVYCYKLLPPHEE